MHALPPPLARPRFAFLLFQAGLDYHQAAQALGSSRETVRLICLPFADPRRRVPNKRLMARIVEWTRGDTQPADFYDCTASVARSVAA